MEKVIKQLIAIDRKASAVVEQAKAEFDLAKQSLGDDKSKMTEEYLQKAQGRIEKLKAENEQAADRIAVSIEQRYQKALEEINTAVEQNRAAWVQQITARCLEQF